MMLGMLVHEPADRMLLFLLKFAKFSLKRVLSFGFEHWYKAVRFGFR